MPSLEKNPNFFRLLITSIATYLIILSSMSFIRSVTSTTDENQWITLPSKMYISKEFSGILSKTNAKDGETNSSFTVKLGSLLRDINGTVIKDTLHLAKILKSYNDSSRINLGILNNSLPIKYDKIKVRNADLPVDFIKEMPSCVLIVSVFKGGGSERAGLKAGDYIISINGRTFIDGYDADRYLRVNNSEDVLHYKVLRNNQILEYDVELAKIGVSIIYRKHTTEEHKKTSRLIRFTFYFMLLCFLYSALFERIYYLIFETQLLRMAPFPEILPISLLLLPIAYIYTIGKYSLLDLTIKVPKNIQYILLSALWKITFIGIILLGIWFLSNWRFNFPNIKLSGTSITVLNSPLSTELQEVYTKMLIIFLSLFGVFVFWLLNKGIKNVLDKKFYQVRFDYRRAATEFSDIIKKGTISELSASIAKELIELFHLKRIGVILFKNEERVIAQDYIGFDYKSFGELCLQSGRKLSEAIREFHGEFRIEYLYEPIKTIFHDYKFSYIVPIRSKDIVVGAVLLGEKRSEKSFTREDFNFLSAILTQASIAIENTFLVEECTIQERLKHELEIARRIQIASLPQRVPEVEGLDISGISMPALEVGGDFFDYLNGTMNEITVIVGDVSGKGTSAALYMSKIQGILRTLNEFMLTPRELFVRANQLLYKYLEKGAFVTVIAAKFDSSLRKVNIARAGHLPIYYYKSLDNSVTKILPKGILLGKSRKEVFDGNIEEINMDYSPGDVFLFISDGVIEARNSKSDDFDETRLMETFKNNVSLSSENIMDNIVKTVSDFSDEVEPYDDLTIVVVKAELTIN